MLYVQVSFDRNRWCGFSNDHEECVSACESPANDHDGKAWALAHRLLKMDVEGHEWQIFQDILMREEPFVPFDQQQVSVEFHGALPVRFGRVMAKLEQAGLYAFQREPNPFHPCVCVEYSFARFTPADHVCVEP